MKFSKFCIASVFFLLFTSAKSFAADEFIIDTEGAHAFVQFRYKHLGYSWLYARFNKFEGTFTYDAKDDSKNKVEVTVDIASVDSNHAERDKHFRSDDFFNTAKYPKATFKSTSYKTVGKNKAIMKGKLTVMGVTKDVSVDVDVIGGGDDPWGGYRQGFEGRLVVSGRDFGMKRDLGEVELTWSAEGIRKKK